MLELGEQGVRLSDREGSQPDADIRPVFERGASPEALTHIPTEVWLDCSGCAEERFAA